MEKDDDKYDKKENECFDEGRNCFEIQKDEKKAKDNWYFFFSLTVYRFNALAFHSTYL